MIDVAGDGLGVIVPLSPSAKEETAGVEWYDSGIGFAIPMDDVWASAERLKKGKDLFPGILGVTMKEGGMDDPPVIDHVRDDSPAEHAGIKAGDVLTELDGHTIDRRDAIKQALGRRYAGDKVKIVVRRGKSNIAAETTLADVLPPYEPGFLGILPAPVAGEQKTGAAVRYVFANSAAAKAGIEVGDRIENWNGKIVAEADQLRSAVRLLRPGAVAHAVVARTLDEPSRLNSSLMWKRFRGTCRRSMLHRPHLALGTGPKQAARKSSERAYSTTHCPAIPRPHTGPTFRTPIQRKMPGDSSSGLRPLATAWKQPFWVAGSLSARNDI